MQFLLTTLFLFIFGCMGGWVIEVLFRRLFSAKRWVNPGFMKGPWLPLYGFGVVVMFAVCYLCVSLFSDAVPLYNPAGGLFGREGVSGPTWYDIIPIVIMWLGMNTLEFLAGVIFVKGFKVKLWDYSNMRGNIMGIVCPVFSVIWFLVAVVFYYLIDPFMFGLFSGIHNYMFGGNGQIAHFGFIFIMGIVYGFMIYDFVVSIEMFKKISAFARDMKLTERYESVKMKWSESVIAAKKKMGIKEKQPKEPTESPIKDKIAGIIYINPEKQKKKTSNYDEKGRPKKEEE